MSSYVQHHSVRSHFNTTPFANNTLSSNKETLQSSIITPNRSPTPLSTKQIGFTQPSTPLSSERKSSKSPVTKLSNLDSITVAVAHSDHTDTTKHFHYSFVVPNRSFSSNSSRFSLSSSSRSMDAPNRMAGAGRDDCSEEKVPTDCLTVQSPPVTLPASSTLMIFLDEAVKSGFTIQAQKKELGRQKRPIMLPGYSVRDWHSKLELRKARLSSAVPPRRISRLEVQQHNALDDLWVVIRGVVYDVTEFQRFHPSFDNVLAKCGGHDITSLVDIFHPWVSVQSFLVTYALGVLEVE